MKKAWENKRNQNQALNAAIYQPITPLPKNHSWLTFIRPIFLYKAPELSSQSKSVKQSNQIANSLSQLSKYYSLSLTQLWLTPWSLSSLAWHSCAWWLVHQLPKPLYHVAKSKAALLLAFPTWGVEGLPHRLAAMGLSPLTMLLRPQLTARPLVSVWKQLPVASLDLVLLMLLLSLASVESMFLTRSAPPPTAKSN